MNSANEIIAWLKRNVRKTDTFLDIGANIGDISRAITDAKFKICVEANPEIETDGDCDVLIKKLVLDKPGKKRFFMTKNPSQSTIYGDRFKEGEGRWQEIEVTTIDDILDEYGIDGDIVMKLDVELSEPLVWEGMQGHIKQFRAIIMEFLPTFLNNDTDTPAGKFKRELQKHFKVEGFSEYDILLTRP